jgi:hypothetical protein
VRACRSDARKSAVLRLTSSLCAALSVGCATYSDHMLAAHDAAAREDWASAEQQINSILGVDSRDVLPETWTSEKSLAVLERAIVLQAQGAWRESARDLSAAETELELLDFSVDAVGTIGTYVYSDSAGEYRTPPLERVALNVVNMLNYLSITDLHGAAVEARRYQVIRDYIENLGLDMPKGRIGAYLAGFVFERLGESDRALRYYQDVQAEAVVRSLEKPIARRARQPEKTRDVLVVIGAGRSPIKVPKRIPIGAAIGIAGTAITGDWEFLQHSVFKTVVYPELEEVPSLVQGARVQIDDRAADLELVTDVAAEVRREYDQLRPRIIAAALTRMAARAAVSEGAMAAGRSAGGAGEVVGIVAGLGAEAALVALDKPDTRSWTFLPARVWVARVPVVAGAHEVVVTFEGEGVGERRVPIDVIPGGYTTVVVTEPR